PKEVWVIAPPVGVLCQHIKREYLCRQRSQHYRHSLVLRPSSHAGWQPPAAEVQPNVCSASSAISGLVTLRWKPVSISTIKGFGTSKSRSSARRAAINSQTNPVSF